MSQKILRIARHPNGTVTRFTNRRISVVRLPNGKNMVQVVMASPEVDDKPPMLYRRYRQRSELSINLSNEACEALMVALSDYVQRGLVHLPVEQETPAQS